MTQTLICFPTLLFISSLVGIALNRHRLMLLLICIEIMLLSMTLNMLILPSYIDVILLHANALYLMTIAAVESAIGLSILVTTYKVKGSISLRMLSLLKG